jgi:hypothetical protein
LKTSKKIIKDIYLPDNKRYFHMKGMIRLELGAFRHFCENTEDTNIF